MKQYVLPNDKQIVTMLSSISKPHTISNHLQWALICQLSTV